MIEAQALHHVRSLHLQAQHGVQIAGVETHASSNVVSAWGRQDMGGGKDTMVGRTDVIPDDDGPIYVSSGGVLMH